VKQPGYIDYVLDMLMPLGGITSRRMFGGYGLYRYGIIFAIVADDILYFKTDAQTCKAYQAYDAVPFTYEGKDGQRVALSYWQVPAEVLENQEILRQWVDQAVAVSKQAKKK